jgi:hypothetical protein
VFQVEKITTKSANFAIKRERKMRATLDEFRFVRARTSALPAFSYTLSSLLMCVDEDSTLN